MIFINLSLFAVEKSLENAELWYKIQSDFVGRYAK